MAIFYPPAEGPRSPTCLTALSLAHVIGEVPPRGTAAGYWGALARTVDGIEAALTWGPSAGGGRGGRPSMGERVTPADRGRGAVEVVRIVDGRGKGQSGGLFVRATARFDWSCRT